MGPKELGELFLVLENDTTLTREERELRQSALLHDYFCLCLGPMPASCTVAKTPLDT